MAKPIHQLVHTLSYGDAISTEVLALQRVFRGLGLESEIYSINAHPKLKGQARDFESFPADYTGELILHYSLGSPLNSLYLSLNKAVRTLIYHNLTPAKWFKGVNPRIVADIEDGLRELPILCRESSRLLADSAFNAAELRALGFGAEVLDLPLDREKWDRPRNEGIYNVVKNDPSLHVLHVGRLAPNKCIEDIIKPFYFLHKYINPQSKLWLVGIDIDTELYSFSLKRLADGLGIGYAVQFVGCLDDSEVRSMYEAASVYLCMSEHEGFCLPILEAMHFGLPVVSFASTALPETVGSGGILLGEKRHFETAALMQELFSNQELRGRMIAAGKARVAEFSFDKFGRRAADIFAGGANRQTANC